MDLYILPSLGTDHLYPLTLTGICQALSYKKVTQLHTFVIRNCIYYLGKGKAVILISAIKYSISVNYELQNTKKCNDFFKYWPRKQHFTRQETNVQVKTANGSDQACTGLEGAQDPTSLQDCDRSTSHLIKHNCSVSPSGPSTGSLGFVRALGVYFLRKHQVACKKISEILN